MEFPPVFYGERLKSNLIFNMTTIESADCGHARSRYRCYTGIWVQALHYLLELEHLNRYVFGFVERTTCWYNGFAYDYDDPSQILKERIAWFSLLNPASKAVALGKYESLNCIRQATPQAMPQAFFQNFRIFQNFSPRRRLRLRLQANKNLHMPSGYALSILLHNICPQAMLKFAYANFLCL
ncbi:hypothetical protein T4E_3877 [Trichinella pseudospiralis]|uniref:Uncharacterized protein n=1 Tax=Trichinella pseudospiralis TaxID=6337 RepID=A0A0V0XSX7_TRIPS|nr:hypothetical protein T4E_3877 [Trichinella pseudospiralis]